jgi:hypothetical protein
MRIQPAALISLVLLVSVSGCSAVVVGTPQPTPVSVPAFPNSAGALEPTVPAELAAAFEELPPAATADALLVAVAERVQELHADEQVDAGWAVGPAGESATAWVHVTGTMDDSIAGEELRLELEGAGGEWRVVFVESSVHCRRDVDADSQLCV